MNVLFVTAEVDPFSKVGGLADVAAALPLRLREMGHDVRVIAPAHRSSMAGHRAAAKHRLLSVAIAGAAETIDVAMAEGAGGLPVQLIANAHYFDREQVYGELDDLMRYQFFCRAVLEVLQEDDDWIPDILHLNDWHAAPLAFGLRNMAWSNPKLRGVASVFTIHNLRYRGPDELNDFLSQAIYYSDIVTTVSPTYASEILTPEFGEGLDPLLRLRGDTLRGILNGLNADLFNPRTDRHIQKQFDLGSIDERDVNRAALRAELELPDDTGPILAMVTRLTEQKGIDLVLRALPEIIAAGGQLVVLGDGDKWLKDELERLETEFRSHVRLVARFDEGLAQRIYAGCDLFLMPSRYEPCGLGQLIAMRYGAIPIGRRTGGLADTILDLDEHPEGATGFLFDAFSTVDFVAAFDRAVRAFRDEALWDQLQRNAMSRDYSWRAAANNYLDAYGAALRARGIFPNE